MPQEYRISELAQKAGVSKRTIHYYVGRGLLPPPEGAGVGSTYGEEHLLKLLLIKKLQEKYLPLDKIREMIIGLSTEEARRITEDEKDYESRLNSFKIESYEDDSSEAVSLDTQAPKDIAIPKDRAYIRAELGLGIELHFPAELLQEKVNIIRSIEKYCRKLINDKEK